MNDHIYCLVGESAALMTEEEKVEKLSAAAGQVNRK